MAAPGLEEGNERGGIVKNQLAHQLVGPLPRPQDVEELASFQFGDRLGADHAAVGDDADARDAEAALQAIDRGNEDADVGGVSRPHLRADGAAVAVEENGQDHLAEVGPMVLGEAAPAERSSARALEIEAGRIHEDDVERGQEVAAPREQALLQEVLQTTRRERRRPVLLGFGQLLAEPGHGSIEMMQIEAVDALDPTIQAPAVGGAIGAAAEQPMQYGEERRALE